MYMYVYKYPPISMYNVVLCTLKHREKNEFKLGLCDNEKCYITIMMIIITIIVIIFWMTSILFGAFLISKNTKLIAQTSSKISDKIKVE